MHHTDVGSTQSCRLTSNRGVDSTGRGRIVDTLAEGGRRGVAIGLSLGRVPCDSNFEAFKERQERQLARAGGLRSGSGAEDSILDQLSPVDEST